MTTKYELVYFSGRGRGELLRYIMYQSKIQFEDKRLSWEQFAEIKPKISTGVLPALFVDGKELNEGHPIARYLADVGGLVGKTQWERAQADSIVNQVKAYMDDNKEFNAWLHDNAMGKLAESKAAFQKYKEIVIPKLGKLLTTLLEKNNNTGWLVGNEVTWADLYAGELMDRIISTDPTAMNAFPKACELHKKVHSLPNLQAYCKERSPFTW